MNRAVLPQIKAIRALIAKLNLDKDDVIYSASKGRTTSTRELTMQEAAQLLNFLKGNSGQKDAANDMRRKVISICYDMGMVDKHGKIDMARVNKLVQTKGYLKPKTLNQYTLQELPKLVAIMGKIRDHYILKRSVTHER